MQWEKEAEERLQRVPFFIRKKVKKQIEDFVYSQGKSLVTNLDVTRARQQLADGNSIKTAGGSLTEGELDKIAAIVDRGVVIEGLDTRYRQFKVCGGAAGCPLSLIDEKSLALSLKEIAGEMDLDGFIAGGIDGPALFHHRFKVALAGCPNNCSQPQIADFALIGQARPHLAGGKCNHCRLCLETCLEKAIILETEGPLFDYDLCLNCGDCARVCPRDVITDEKIGYKVLIGGKLGRHPRLAGTVAELVDESTVKEMFRRTLALFKSEAFDGERFADLVNRLGFHVVKSFLWGSGENH
ncbi:MAG TPA: 4Fe-4S binding protein [Clostridia bacterium]|nr:4Fe-4S binding protein [Clostridia bacterium]